MTLRLGTRGSPLARRQAERVQEALAKGSDSQLVVIESTGDRDQTSPLDRPEQAGVFTSALTQAVESGEVDAAVHSLKDLPLVSPTGIEIVAVLHRDDPADRLLVREDALDPSRPLGLVAGARVGSSAPRRQTQLLNADPSLLPVDVRGNIGRRLSLIESGVLDGLLMASAALDRLGSGPPTDVRSVRLDPVCYPGAPGQGAIAVQAKTGSRAARVLEPLDDPVTREAVMLERRVLAGLGGGCGLPLGAYAWCDEKDTWNVSATLAKADWRESASPGVAVARLSGQRSDALAESMLERLTQLQSEPRGEPSPAGAGAKPSPVTRTLLTTLEEESATRYGPLLSRHGWRVIPWTLIESQPTGVPPPAVREPFWVAVTSVRAVPFVQRLVERPDGSWRSFRVAANGPATAFALRCAGLPVHAVSRDGTGRGVADVIDVFPAERKEVVWPAAKQPAGGLSETLRERGWVVHHWPVYRTRARDPVPVVPVEPAVDAFLVTSPSNAKALAAAKTAASIARSWIALGPTTAQALREAGYPVDAVAHRPSPTAIASLLLESERPQAQVRRGDGHSVKTMEGKDR